MITTTTSWFPSRRELTWTSNYKDKDYGRASALLLQTEFLSANIDFTPTVEYNITAGYRQISRSLASEKLQLGLKVVSVVLVMKTL